ncbi:TetR-like C-terminal domain-containing protein [Glaciibacter flavus]
MDVILARGVERGEIDPARITPRISSLPFDLFRHELLMTLQAVPDETIEEFVDEIFLPLVEPR